MKLMVNGQVLTQDEVIELLKTQGVILKTMAQRLGQMYELAKDEDHIALAEMVINDALSLNDLLGRLAQPIITKH